MQQVIRIFHVFQYSLLTVITWFAAFYFSWSSIVFLIQAEAADLLVVEVQMREDADGDREYRSIFALAGAEGLRQEYPDGHWRSHKIHLPGDIVKGLHHPKTGELRSGNRMHLPVLFWIAACWSGLVSTWQVALLLMGVPEHELPFRLWRGRRRFFVELPRF
ncbi:hypothetical protein [Gemmobacter serpentinus]|uniref:hypothetical protein n=1 Tax=Gemmobacter serpentinus TaxID=2652247 RepID=UPI00124D807F|nr:hypothetical protein [Gemmobacter serpentinus]